MRPSPEEIRRAVPGAHPDDQVVYVEKEEMEASGFIESIVVCISNVAVKVFRSPPIRKVIFAVVMGLAALDGTQFCSLPEQKNAQLLAEIADSNRWLESIVENQTPQTANRYFLLGGPGNPSPSETPFNAPAVKIMAPISGALALTRDERFSDFRSGIGV